MAHRLQYRRDTKANWLKYNPVLMEGEVGYETDTHHQKVGDGVSTYSELEYEVGIGNITQILGQSTTLVPSQKLVTNEINRIDETIGSFPFAQKDYEGELSHLLVEGYWDDNKQIHKDTNYRTIKYLLSGDYYLEIINSEGSSISFGYRAYDENGVVTRLNSGKLDVSQHYLVGVLFPVSDELGFYKIRITQKRASQLQLEETVNNIQDNILSSTGISEYPVFSNRGIYAIGDIVRYEGKLYKFIIEHELATWNPDSVEPWSEKKEREELNSRVGSFPFSQKDYEGNLADLLVEGYWNDQMIIHNDSNYRTIKYLLSGDYYVEVFKQDGNKVSIGYRIYDENKNPTRLNDYKVDISSGYYVGVVFPYSEELYTYKIKVTQKRATKEELNSTNQHIENIESELSIITFTDGVYYGDNTGEGNLQKLGANTLCSTVMPCKKGDRFYIRTKGRNVGHPYFIVGENIVGEPPLKDSGLSNDEKEYYISVSDSSARYLIVNADATYKDSILIKKNDIADITNDIANITFNDKLSSFENIPITSDMVEDGKYWHDNLTLRTNANFAAVNRAFNLKPGFSLKVKNSSGAYVSVRIRYKDIEGNISFILTDSFSTENGCIVGIYSNKLSETDFTKGGTIEIKPLSIKDIKDKTIICCWGSSSVEGYLGNRLKYLRQGEYIENAEGSMSFPKMLASLVDSSKYEVWNCGIGGEGTPTILARMGAIPMYNDTEFVLPADGSYVDIARYDNQTYLKSIFDDSIVVPNEAYAGIETYNARSVLNPVYINGIECTLDLYSPTGDSIVNNSGQSGFKNGAFRIKRNTAVATDVAIPAGTIITTYAAKLFQSRNIIHIYLIGANGGWYNWEDFKAKMNKCIDWFGNKYIVLGYHNAGIFTDYSENQKTKFSISLPSANDLRDYQKKEYGLKFLDLRYLMSKRWFADFVKEFGLKIYYVSSEGVGTFNGNVYTEDDISVIPDEYHQYLEEMPVEWKNYNIPSDIQCYNLEMPPTCLMADGASQTGSGQHCNYYGYKVMGSYVYKKLVEIGYIVE